MPTKLPEGFETTAVDVSKSEHGNFVKFCAVYESETHYLVLQIRQISDINTERFEKDTDTVTQYTKMGSSIISTRIWIRAVSHGSMAILNV